MEEGSDMTTCTYHCRPWDSHFTSLRAFDAHRQGPAGARRCEFPDAGLAERIGGCKLADPDVPKVNVTLYELESSEGYREYRRLKSGPDGWQFHPFLCHALDTLAVSEALWERALTVTARERLAQGLGLTPGEALAWTRALAGAHDIGKASPTFQALWGPGRQNLEACVPFPRIVGSAPHGVISTLVLAAELQSRGTPKNDAETLARAIGGHHGSFPRRREQNAVGPNAIGTGTWDQVRAALLEVIFWIAGEPGRHPNSGG